MEDAYIINGGKPLSGTVRLSGAKNIALKAIIGSLLFDGPVTLTNAPRINDVQELIHLIQILGGTAAFTEKNTIQIDGRGITKNTIDLLHASKIRASFMFFAPLLQKFSDCHVPNPGGCRLGARSIDRIIDGMKALGVQVEYDSNTGYYHATKKQPIQGEFAFAKSSHTGTETLILLSVVGTGTTILRNAALEPEIDQLIAFLNESGAQIVRDGTTITITSVAKLSQTKPFEIQGDRNEAVTFAILGLVTKGTVEIANAAQLPLQTFLAELKKAGCQIDQQGDALRFSAASSLKATSIETGPHPGFMTDWQPNWAVLMTQAEGETTIRERMFENRFAYVDELNKLGAKIEFIDVDVTKPEEYYYFNYQPGKEYRQAIKITGPRKLHNGVLTIHDLRAGATVAIATLAAEGESIINGASILERGYEDFVEKVQALGGDIKRA